MFQRLLSALGLIRPTATPAPAFILVRVAPRQILPSPKRLDVRRSMRGCGHL
jgi:hypothetical protein